jgi:hypothetical protein
VFVHYVEGAKIRRAVMGLNIYGDRVYRPRGDCEAFTLPGVFNASVLALRGRLRQRDGGRYPNESVVVVIDDEVAGEPVQGCFWAVWEHLSPMSAVDRLARLVKERAE